MTVTDIDKNRALMSMFAFAWQCPDDAVGAAIRLEFLDSVERLAAAWGMSDDLPAFAAGVHQIL